MKSIAEKLKEFAPESPSHWREEAEYRRANRNWLRYSQMVAVKMLERMHELNITQKVLAEKMGCSQQYVSKILQGKENLSLETLCKIEDSLNLQLILEPELA